MKEDNQNTTECSPPKPTPTENKGSEADRAAPKGRTPSGTVLSNNFVEIRTIFSPENSKEAIPLSSTVTGSQPEHLSSWSSPSKTNNLSIETGANPIKGSSEQTLKATMIAKAQRLKRRRRSAVKKQTRITSRNK